MTPCILVTTDPIMVQLLLKGAILLLAHSVKRCLANPNQYLKPKYTEEGKFILEHLRYNDVLEVEQKDLPNSLHTVFKLVINETSPGDNFTKMVQTEIRSMTSCSIETLEILQRK